MTKQDFHEWSPFLIGILAFTAGVSIAIGGYFVIRGGSPSDGKKNNHDYAGYQEDEDINEIQGTGDENMVNPPDSSNNEDNIKDPSPEPQKAINKSEPRLVWLYTSQKGQEKVVLYFADSDRPQIKNIKIGQLVSYLRTSISNYTNDNMVIALDVRKNTLPKWKKHKALFLPIREFRGYIALAAGKDIKDYVTKPAEKKLMEILSKSTKTRCKNIAKNKKLIAACRNLSHDSSWKVICKWFKDKQNCQIWDRFYEERRKEFKTGTNTNAAYNKRTKKKRSGKEVKHGKKRHKQRRKRRGNRR